MSSVESLYFVDRALAVIKPKQPFLDWLNSIGEHNILTLESLRSDCTAILIPEYQEPEEAILYIDEIYQTLFELELSSWYEESKYWPTDRSLKTFWEWFDIELSTILIDTCHEPLKNRAALFHSNDEEE